MKCAGWRAAEAERRREGGGREEEAQHPVPAPRVQPWQSGIPIPRPGHSSNPPRYRIQPSSVATGERAAPRAVPAQNHQVRAPSLLHPPPPSIRRAPPPSSSRPAPPHLINTSRVVPNTRRLVVDSDESDSSPPSPSPSSSSSSSSSSSPSPSPAPSLSGPPNTADQLLADIPIETFITLTSCPTTNKPVYGAHAKDFGDAAERLASAFLSDPSDETILDFLCLVKVGLVPGLKAGVNLKERLRQFPRVEWPEGVEGGRVRASTTLAEDVKREVESGHLGRAARRMEGSTSVLGLSEEVMEELRAKHPTGHPSPFSFSPGPSPGVIPTEDLVLPAFSSFASDTAPGISGWTQPLLAIALKREPVVQLVTLLSSLIAQGTAPGHQFLCSSRLTPLAKPDGGVRPIAVGELLYRLCAKVLIRFYFRSDMLLPCQLGVGSKGGVEPVVRAIEQAVEGELEGDYTHLVSLDFSNAFNTVGRRDLAAGLRDFAPSLYRAGRWLYGKAAVLVVRGGDGQVEVLQSSEGVRQGDPLGPLFFSIAIRQRLEDLILHLGPGTQVLGYLDDLNVLAGREGVLEEVEEFWEQEGGSVQLNRRKCKEMRLVDIAEDGLEILGTMVGPADMRKEFLEQKVEDQINILNQLPQLPSQQALLILSQCLQQNLRHLQRSLKTSDMPGCWDRLDSALQTAMLFLRRSPRRLASDSDLLTLPTRLGGLGILSHSEIAPHAYAAACESSDHTLAPAFGLAVDDSVSLIPQRVRCNKIFQVRQTQLLSSLNPIEKHSVAESASTLGRRWLYTIPFSPNLSLSDAQVAAGLHFRTLCPGRTSLCSLCSLPNSFGHDDVCSGRAPWNLARHEQLKRIILTSLSSASGLDIVCEPVVPGTSLRTDFRVTCPTNGPREYDLTVVSLSTAEAGRVWAGRERGEDVTEWEDARKGVEAVLEVAAGRKRVKYAEKVAVPFSPLVMSAGGAMGEEGVKRFEEWGMRLLDSQFLGMMSRISVALLRARCHFWRF